MTRSYRLAPAEPIAALNRVKLIECGEPLVDLRLHLPGFKVTRESAVPWAREGVADRLKIARRGLAPYDIGLREAWRSLKRQQFIYDRYFAGLDPLRSLAIRRRLANRFFAPYDQKAPPGHSTGAAIDLWLLDEQGEPIDLSGPGERFKSAPTFSAKLPERVREMRLLLHDALLDAGFTNCRDEWWHYSYGDAGWAVRAGEKTCIYGSAEPPKNEYEERDRAFFEAFVKDPPF
ncbi:MAG: M15 family metallopeptidase [Fimbriimonadales bacterium]